MQALELKKQEQQPPDISGNQSDAGEQDISRLAKQTRKLDMIGQEKRRMLEKSQMENDEREQQRWRLHEAERQKHWKHAQEQEHRRLVAFEQSRQQEQLCQLALTFEQNKRDRKLEQLSRRKAQDNELMRERHYLKELRKLSNIGERARLEEYERLQTTRRLEASAARAARRSGAKNKATADHKAAMIAFRVQQDAARWQQRFDWCPQNTY